MIRPVLNPEDDVLSYVGRLMEWERAQNEEAIAQGMKIDAANDRRRKAVHGKAAVTRECERSRITVHDLAQNNPVLRNILRKIQE